MTYDSREISLQDGAPVELYEFTRGSLTYRFTSADADFSLLGQTYTSETLQRGQIETSAERARNAITITCRREFLIADLFRVSPPTDVIGVVIKRTHRADADVAVIWTGRLLNCSFEGAQARLQCEPASSSLRRPGLRRLYQRQCPHVLYSTACGVNRAAHSTTTTVTAISGLALSVASLAAKPYGGGFVEWQVASGVIERRFIESFSGLALNLSQAFQGLQVGDTVTVSPGCDHTTATCSGTYGNLPNYGGFPFIPTKNPFDGTPVY
jgi:uncharacterized phage protein (TIGR02218 family)